MNNSHWTKTVVLPQWSGNGYNKGTLKIMDLGMLVKDQKLLFQKVYYIIWKNFLNDIELPKTQCILTALIISPDVHNWVKNIIQTVMPNIEECVIPFTEQSIRQLTNLYNNTFQGSVPKCRLVLV